MHCLDHKIQLFPDKSHIFRDIFHVYPYYLVSKSKDCYAKNNSVNFIINQQFVSVCLPLKLLTNKSFHSLRTMCKHAQLLHMLSEIFAADFISLL